MSYGTHAIAFWVLLHLLWFPASAQEPLTAEAAVRIALQKNYAILLAKNATAIAHNNVTYGHAGFLPLLQLNGANTNNIDNVEMEFISGEGIQQENAFTTNWNASLNLNWTLFDGMQMFVRYKELEEIAEMSRHELRAAVEQTLEEVLLAYYDVVRQQQKVIAYEALLEVAEERYAIAEKRYELGSGSRFEVSQAEVDLHADRSALLEQQQALDAACTALNRLLSRDAEAACIPSDTLSLPPEMAYETVKTALLEHNALLQANASDERIALLRHEALKGQRYPRLELGAGYGYGYTFSEAGFVVNRESHGSNFGLMLALPLFNGFNLNRQLQQAQMEVHQAELRYESARNNLMAETYRLFKQYQYQRQRAMMDAENVHIAAEHAELAATRYDAGTISGIELREAQIQAMEAVHRLADARYAAKDAEMQLRRLSGMLLQELEVDTPAGAVHED